VTGAATDFHLLSTCGPVRAENQDAGSAWRGPADEVGLVVSDGMGGHARGREAAHLVVRECLGTLRSRDDDEPWETTFARAVGRAHGAVRDAGDGSGTAMGATVALAVVQARDGRPWLHLAHVGDSRVYLYRGRSLYRLTADHSLVERMVRDGLLDETEAFHHPDRNVLQRAIGQEDPPEPEIAEALPLQDRDLVLVSSDGLHGALPEPELAAEIARGGDAAAVCRALLDAALEAGSDDNVTVGCARIGALRRPRRPTRRR
jgi:PPM family protein phosphatase